MPTIRGEYYFGALPVVTERALRLLPCARCGAGGPHAFRVERDHGLSVLCQVCQSQRVQDGGQDVGDPLHAASPAGVAA